MARLVMSFVLVASLALSACATQIYSTDKPNARLVKSGYHHLFFSGIWQEKEVNVARLCGGTNNIASVETKLDAFSIIVGVISFGFYTPTKYKVYCSN